MYIVRWLIGHPMLAVWFLGAIAILLSYGASNKKEVNHSNNGQMSSESVGSNHTAPETQLEGMAAHESNDLNKKKIDDAVDTHNTQKIEQDKSIGAEEAKKVSSDKRAEVISSLNNSSAMNSAESKAVDQKAIMASASPEGSKSSSEAVKKNPEIVMDLDQSSTEEILKMAREAYWNNGLDEAAQIYQQLIKLEPKVLEHKGELGNVYWRQGYPKKAAELYSEIAIPMIEEGNADRVANMVGFIGLFYPDRASVIHDRIQRMAGQNKNDQGN